MFSLAFWKGAAERGIKTFVQATVAGLIVSAPIVEQPWLIALGLGATAAVFSLATSIGNADFTAGAAPEPARTTHITYNAAPNGPADKEAFDAFLRRVPTVSGGSTPADLSSDH